MDLMWSRNLNFIEPYMPIIPLVTSSNFNGGLAPLHNSVNQIIMNCDFLPIFVFFTLPSLMNLQLYHVIVRVQIPGRFKWLPFPVYSWRDKTNTNFLKRFQATMQNNNISQNHQRSIGVPMSSNINMEAVSVWRFTTGDICVPCTI